MDEPESADTWSAWFLDAIRKIRSQKQRPSVERICHAIRQHHNYHEEEIAEHLEVAVKRGDVLKIFNKGQSSYKDPGGLQSKPLKVGKASDLSKVLGKAVRELGEREGSSLKNIERYIRQSHTVEEEAEGDLRTALRLSAKRAVDRGLVIQDGRLFRQPDRPPYLKKHADTSHITQPETPVAKVSHFFHYSLLEYVCLCIYGKAKSIEMYRIPNLSNILKIKSADSATIVLLQSRNSWKYLSFKLKVYFLSSQDMIK